MADGWVRAVATNPNNSGFFGSVPLIGVSPGQTVLRSWWNVGFQYLVDSIEIFPPGSSLLRAGVVYAEAGLAPLETPTPITNADADWLYVATLNPLQVELDRVTNVGWNILWGFPHDISLKSQRRNDTATNMNLYVAWEMALNDETPGFTMNGWNTSMDCYVRTPDA